MPFAHCLSLQRFFPKDSVHNLDFVVFVLVLARYRGNRATGAWATAAADTRTSAYRTSSLNQSTKTRSSPHTFLVRPHRVGRRHVRVGRTMLQLRSRGECSSASPSTLQPSNTPLSPSRTTQHGPFSGALPVLPCAGSPTLEPTHLRPYCYCTVGRALYAFESGTCFSKLSRSTSKPPPASSSIAVVVRSRSNESCLDQTARECVRYPPRPVDDDNHRFYLRNVVPLLVSVDEYDLRLELVQLRCAKKLRNIRKHHSSSIHRVKHLHTWSPSRRAPSVPRIRHNIDPILHSTLLRVVSDGVMVLWPPGVTFERTPGSFREVCICLSKLGSSSAASSSEITSRFTHSSVPRAERIQAKPTAKPDIVFPSLLHWALVVDGLIYELLKDEENNNTIVFNRRKYDPKVDAEYWVACVGKTDFTDDGLVAVGEHISA
ncbi:hypothetical protein HMN09_00726500 [Mycena chlorophos]|uniref:Uncharacterized protein n=1 Tax=Mycena chlorophos TaxID=658473 RepID=A0A8H6W5L3_MYCCL|nr:hypothetical protein HMN09_00726500 [Mycena chlorophos]